MALRPKATMGTWKSAKTKWGFRKGRNPSQTPGHLKNPTTCQLTPIGGLPRKFWGSGRSYKHKNYTMYCTYMDRVNGK